VFVGRGRSTSVIERSHLIWRSSTPHLSPRSPRDGVNDFTDGGDDDLRIFSGHVVSAVVGDETGAGIASAVFTSSVPIPLEP
jgi:hypothetical protein